MTINPNNTEVGFIGLGIMGQSMARHIQNAGYKLHVYNRTKSKPDELVAAGAQWQDSPGEVANNSDVVITMVGDPYESLGPLKNSNETSVSNWISNIAGCRVTKYFKVLLFFSS